jgi:hypothetical protein
MFSMRRAGFITTVLMHFQVTKVRMNAKVLNLPGSRILLRSLEVSGCHPGMLYHLAFLLRTGTKVLL